jgi:hypothetical protein
VLAVNQIAFSTKRFATVVLFILFGALQAIADGLAALAGRAGRLLETAPLICFLLISRAELALRRRTIENRLRLYERPLRRHARGES